MPQIAITQLEYNTANSDCQSLFEYFLPIFFILHDEFLFINSFICHQNNYLYTLTQPTLHVVKIKRMRFL